MPVRAHSARRFFTATRRVPAVAAAWFLGAVAAWAGQKVWIFAGVPGDDIHHKRYEEILGDLKTAFVTMHGIDPKDLRVFYGPQQAGYDGPCTKGILLDELKKAAAATRDSADPVWALLIGHANSVPGGVMFNIPGPDATPREIADALKDASRETPLVFIAATTASQHFIRPLAAPGRFVISADAPKDPESEPDYPLALAKALGDRSSDANRDGMLSITEWFLATRRVLDGMYQEGGYMVREHAQLDGNCDGRGTTRPSLADAEPASQVGLRKPSAGRKPGFD